MSMYPNFDISKYFMARILDTFLFYGLSLVAICIGGAIMAYFEPFLLALSESHQGLLLVVFVLVVWYLYLCIVLKRSGQTLGMKVFSLQIVPINKNKLSYIQVILWGIFIPMFPIIFIEMLNLYFPPHSSGLAGYSNTKIQEIKREMIE